MGDCERVAFGFGSLVAVVLRGVFLTEVLTGFFTGVSVFRTDFAAVLGAGLVATFADALAGDLTSFLEISEVFGVADVLVFFAGMNVIFESPSMICKIILQKLSTGFTLSV
jgi:hypothetical protein